MTLVEIAQRLAQPNELGGSAPSLVSLKRWSAAGLLSDAQHVPTGRKRPAYEYEPIKMLCLARRALRQAAVIPPATSATTADQVSDRAAARTGRRSKRLRACRSTDGQAGALAHSATHPAAHPATHSVQLQAAASIAESLDARLHRIEAQLSELTQAVAVAAQQQSVLGALAAAVGDLEHTRRTLMLRYDENAQMRARLGSGQTGVGPLGANAAAGGSDIELTLARLAKVATRLEQLQWVAGPG